MSYNIRVTGGEKLIGLPAAIRYPGFKNGDQYFPFRTMSMLLSFATLIGVSKLTNHLFESGKISMDRDILGAVERRKACEGRRKKRNSVHPTNDVVLSENVEEKSEPVEPAAST